MKKDTDVVRSRLSALFVAAIVALLALLAGPALGTFR